MNRLLSLLIVLGLATGLSACDKQEKAPLPKMAAGEIQQQAKQAVGAVENAAKKEKDEFVAAVENDVGTHGFRNRGFQRRYWEPPVNPRNAFLS